MRLLVIEDDPSFRKTLSAVLRRVMPDASFDLDMCSSLMEAKQYLEANPTDIILLDMMLPGGNGMDILRAFPQAEFSVICMTAQEINLELQREVMAHGAAAMLWKPFGAEDLKETLQHVIKMRLKVLNKPIGVVGEFTAATEEADNQTLHIPTDEGVLHIPFEEIICLEADNNYTTIHRTESKPVTTRAFLSGYEPILPSADFFRVNRSFIVRKHYIHEIHLKERKITLQENVVQKPIIVAHSKMKLLRRWRKELRQRLQKKGTAGGGVNVEGTVLSFEC